jgi:hypothetical protein
MRASRFVLALVIFVNAGLFFRCRMCSQFDIYFIFRIASRPNANCIGEA